MEMHVARPFPVAASRLWEVAVVGYGDSETWDRKCLRETGMPISAHPALRDLTFTGDETIPERVVPIHEHRTIVVTQTAELQHDLELLAWKLAYNADTFGVTAGEATP
jgi:hypothetical protein